MDSGPVSPPSVSDAFEGLPHAAAVLGRLDFDEWLIAVQWRDLLTDLAHWGAVPRARTIDAPMVQWQAGVRTAKRHGGGRGPGVDVIVAGLAPADLASYARVGPGYWGGLQTQMGPEQAERALLSDLFSLTDDEDLSVRDALGWLLATAQESPAAKPVSFSYPWIKAGRGTDGWLYAAAGISLAEVLDPDGPAAGLDEATLRAMAALRGVEFLPR